MNRNLFLSTGKETLFLKFQQIKTMINVNRGPVVPSEVKGLYTIIAGLILFSGLLIYSGGLGCSHIGNLSKARYEKSSGSLIRMFSSEDARNYANTKKMITLGNILQTLSSVLMFLGVVLLIKPELLHYELKRCGIIPGSESKKKDISFEKQQ